MHTLSNKTKSSRETNLFSSSAEISISADPDNQDRPSPSLGESKPDRPPRRPRNKRKSKSKTPEEIREKASKLLRKREAAVEYVLGHEDEKNEPTKSSSRRRVVRVDSVGQLNEITMVLKEDDIREVKITEAVKLVGSSKDDLKKQDKLKDDATLASLASVVDVANILSSMENGQLYAAVLAAGAGPTTNVDVDGKPVPQPPELTLQSNFNGIASSAPGAYSVVPQARHRFRDVLLRRTMSRRTTSRQNWGVERTAISRAAATAVAAAAAAGATELQAAYVESLVSATLVPSMAVTETAHHESVSISSSKTCVVHAEGMSFWTFVKRNRKAQCGVLVALLFFCGLITALAVALSGSNNDPSAQVMAPVVDAVSPTSAPIQGTAVSTPAILPTPNITPTPRPSTPPPTTPFDPAKESCEGCSDDNDDDNGASDDAPDDRN